jgi:hypothetical protein
MLPPFPKAFETEEMLTCYSPKFPLPIVEEGSGEGDFTGLINEKLFKSTTTRRAGGLILSP